MTATKAYIDNEIVEITGTGYEPSGEFKIDGKEVSIDSLESLNMLLSMGILANDARLEKTDDLYRIIGDPTEGALVTLAGKANIRSKDINNSFPRLEEIPFDSDRKMMTTLHENFIPEKIVSFTKGAPDIIISKCNFIKEGDNVLPFADELRKRVLEINSKFAKEALRVLAFAYKEYDNLPDEINSDNIEKNMVFVGL